MSWSWLWAAAPRGRASVRARSVFLKLTGGLLRTWRASILGRSRLAAKQLGHDTRAPIGLPAVGQRRQRLEKSHEVVHLRGRQAQRLEDALAVGMQALLVQLGVMLHHVAQRAEAAVVHVRRGLRHVAQTWHAPLAEIAVLRLDVARPGGRAPGRIVVEPAEQVVGVALQSLDSLMPTRIHLSTADEKTDAGVGELAVGEMRPEVAGGAIALADEDAQSFLRRLRVFAERSTVPRCQPIPEFVERRAAADQRLLERRQRLADVDQHLFVVGRRRALK